MVSFIMTAAIIVAAGISRRMGFDKMMAVVGEKSVLGHSIEAFRSCSTIDLIVVVTDEGRFSELGHWEGSPPVLRVGGGMERQESVANGLASLPSAVNLVAIHDGARPLVHPDSISEALSLAMQEGASSLAHPITDTLMRADGTAQLAKEFVSRENLWAMETPQCFQKNLLENAYRTVLAKGARVTDEVSACLLAGIPVRLVLNSRPNLKITFPSDLVLVENLLAEHGERPSKVR